jgi:excinuclease ABC subunit B
LAAHSIRKAAARGERTLVTTLTKKSSERLSDYLSELGIRASYLHSELDALERVRVLNKLREGDFDCVIGINLLREGIDLPEVALVAILDADKEGFLRSERSLIQTAGRAARNRDGRVILYADHITPSMQLLIDGTQKRRQKQIAYNEKHGITPQTIKKGKMQTIEEAINAGKPAKNARKMPVLAENMFTDGEIDLQKLGLTETETQSLVEELTREMLAAAEALEFERAAELRDNLRALQKK